MKLPIPDWLLYLTLLLAMLAYANSRQPATQPPGVVPELGPLLPTESPRDERILVQIDAPQSGIGTAFASSADGDWLTARHVVDSCDEIGVKISARQMLRIERTEIFEGADLARLSSGWAREPLPTDLQSPRQIGELAYMIGYPQGRPGEVVASLLSRGRMQVRGRYRTDEGVLVWSEVARSQGLLGSLGGLSGGPVLDSDGELIGVVAAETPRRGRVYTVAPRNLRQVMAPVDVAHRPLDPDSYTLEADRLRRDRRVAQVVCMKG
ncbi:serine protease [Algimonas porphyrae]|uniref:Serine protease n=1 Tax=Algimonas porphyrae TaxID=1128113 RepID=A0ABQ5UXF7_9PROT|nr:serine protease [Algimonas porphyrae]GLQ19998.1 serine protease [Algimonas porphyrae]